MEQDTRSRARTFDLAAGKRAAGRWLALTGAACCLTPLLPATPAWAHVPLAAFGAAVLVIGCLLAILSDTVDLDLVRRAYKRTTAIGPLRRVSKAEVQSCDRLLLAQRFHVDALGDRTPVWDLILAGPPGRRPIFVGSSSADADGIARDLAYRLALPVEPAPTANAVRGQRIEQAIVAASFAAMACVLFLAVRPIVGGTAHAHRRTLPGTEIAQYASAQRLIRASQLYAMHDFRGAEANLRDVIRHDPSSAEAYNLLAYALADQRKLDSALRAAGSALRLAPESGDILDTVGEMHQRRREWARAMQYYDLALSREAVWSSAETHTKYAQTLLALGRRRDAIAHLRRACQYESPRPGATGAGRWTRLARGLLDRLAAEPAAR